MKKIFFLILLLMSIFGYSQSPLNSYNKAIIPSKFSFQKQDNEYRINSTIKAFLIEKGFEAYLSNETMPKGFLDSNCNKVYIDVVEQNTIFLTKIKVQFKDCRDNLLFSTDLASSNEKEYAKAYNITLLESLKSFEKANYNYSGGSDLVVENNKVNNEEKKDETAIGKEVVSSYDTKADMAFKKVINLLNQKEMILFKTSQPDVFLSIYNDKNGVVIYTNGSWFFESIQEGKIVSEKLKLNL